MSVALGVPLPLRRPGLRDRRPGRLLWRGRPGTARPSRRQGVATAGRPRRAGAWRTTWPLADLAARTSLTASVIQRLLLLLAVPPLLLVGLPSAGVTAGLDPPVAVDWLVRRCAAGRPSRSRWSPSCAVATATTGAVEAEGASAGARLGLDAALARRRDRCSGPGVDRAAGHRPAVGARAGRLPDRPVDRALVPRRRLDLRPPPAVSPVRARPGLLGGRPVIDQQMAGFVAKFATIAVLWTVAFVWLTRAHTRSRPAATPTRCAGRDVERHLERAERTGAAPGLDPPRIGTPRRSMRPRADDGWPRSGGRASRQIRQGQPKMRMAEVGRKAAEQHRRDEPAVRVTQHDHRKMARRSGRLGRRHGRSAEVPAKATRQTRPRVDVGVPHRRVEARGSAERAHLHQADAVEVAHPPDGLGRSRQRDVAGRVARPEGLGARRSSRRGRADRNRRARPRRARAPAPSTSVRAAITPERWALPPPAPRAPGRRSSRATRRASAPSGPPKPTTRRRASPPGAHQKLIRR